MLDCPLLPMHITYTKYSFSPYQILKSIFPYRTVYTYPAIIGQLYAHSFVILHRAIAVYHRSKIYQAPRMASLPIANPVEKHFLFNIGFGNKNYIALFSSN